MDLAGALIGGLATVLVGVFGFAQWLLSERARTRGRDDAMLQWGAEVIDLMAEIEGYCEFGAPPDAPALRLRAAAARASALVDRGRLFFPNVQSQDRGDAHGRAPDRRGFRVAILDEVLRAFYVARHLIAATGPPAASLRGQMRAARQRFVAHLQKEMGASLRKSSAEKTGVTVPPDPLSW